MSKTVLITIMLALTSAASALAGSAMFEISVKIDYDGDNNHQIGTGMILIQEDDFANINVVVFENNSLRISTSQGRGRTGNLFDRQGKVIVKDELAGMIDLSLSPREAGRGDTRVEGQLEVMSRKPGHDKPTFEFNTEPINYVARNNDPYKMSLEIGNGVTRLELSVRNASTSRSASSNRFFRTDGVVFESEYSLYNRDDSKYEVQGRACRLDANSGGDEEDADCSWYAFFPEGQNDSLLYWVTYNIDDIDWIDDTSFDVTIDFSRLYAKNPEKFDPNADEHTFSHATISLFSKEVRTKVGEVLDVILDDAPEGLPFKGRETVRLISRKGD